MQMGVEGGSRHGNSTIGSRSLRGSFAFPDRVSATNGKLCLHIRARPSGRKPWAWQTDRVVPRVGRQSPSFGKGSRLGTRNRRGNGTLSVCHLVPVPFSAVSHAGISGEEAGLHICRGLDALGISCPPRFALRTTRYTFCVIWSGQTAIPSTNCP